MTFALTDELTNNIISAMENQEDVFAVDAASGCLVSLSEDFNNCSSYPGGDNIHDRKCCLPVKVDDDKYYGLPEWKPADGFAVREEFVYRLHSPLAKEKLQEVLHSGRGVFKNFRIVLRDYPEIDKRWHIYKHNVMANKVNEWYNSLREIWGLEKLDQILEVDDSLVYDDFSFDEYKSDLHKDTVLFNISHSQNDDEELPLEVNNVIHELWFECFKRAEQVGQVGYICYSLSDEFAGCITASSIMKKQEQICVVTSLFVSEQFRGLGICTELISLCISKIKKCGRKWIIMPNHIVSELLGPLLTRTGFKKFSSGYILTL